MSPWDMRAPPCPATALTITPLLRSPHRAQSIMPKSCLCTRFVSYSVGSTYPETSARSV